MVGNGDKITLTETWDGKTAIVVLTVEGGLMIITLTFEGIVCKRIHKKV